MSTPPSPLLRALLEAAGTLLITGACDPDAARALHAGSWRLVMLASRQLAAGAGRLALHAEDRYYQVVRCG